MTTELPPTALPPWEAPEIARLLAEPVMGRREVPAARQVFVTRTLRMDKIEAIGFDMDYTLAIYQLRQMEELAFRMTAEQMVNRFGYPAGLRDVPYDPDFVIRGVVVDKLHGNLFKMDRHNHVGRGVHGRRPIPEAALHKLYREEKIHLG